MGELSGRVPTWLRRQAIEESRILVCTPQTLDNQIKKYPDKFETSQYSSSMRLIQSSKGRVTNGF